MDRTGDQQREAGFTLVELMITVAIIGVLAVLASVGYARWTRSAKTGEATSMIAAIKGAQETYRAEALRYLDVSGGNLDAAYYPLGAPTDAKAPWNPASCTGTAVCDGFRILGVAADSAVYYRYSTTAGGADGATHAVGTHTIGPMYDPWFAVKATGDLNNDGTKGYFWSSSVDGLIWSQNPDE